MKFLLDDILIKDCKIVREEPINGIGWALSTSDGGPQFGQPKDAFVHKVRVENFYSENTGDDSLAFFNVKVVISVFFIPNIILKYQFLD